MGFKYLDPVFKQVVVLLSAHLSHAQIADYLGIDRSTVWRTVKLFDEYGIWAMEGKTGRPPVLGEEEILVSMEFAWPRLIDYAISKYIERLTQRHPDLTQEDIQERIWERFGRIVSRPTICRVLKKRDFTRKKVFFFTEH